MSFETTGSRIMMLVESDLEPANIRGGRRREHNRHAHFIPLSLEARNRGRIDHVLVYAPMGFREIPQPALRRLRKTWAKGTDDIAVTLLGIGSREAFLEVGGNAIPELASSATWVNQTPFIPPRFLKANGKDSLEGQVRAELRRRGRA